MKKLIFIIFILFGLNVNAQIILEHTYDSASTINTIGPNGAESSQLMIVKFEISGERYVRINKWGKKITIYDMNHTLLKTISLAGFPMDFNNQAGDILYFSENLFDLDSGIEFMYVVSPNSSGYYTGIYNDDGSLLFSDTAAPAIHPNYPQQQYPIYNTLQGTKMILSYENSMHAKIFRLPGTLSTAIQEANGQLMQVQGISNPYPNPTNNTTRVDYTLPNGVNQGEIVFYDLQGKEIKRFKVDKTFNSLLISTTDIPAGTYYYQLQTSLQASEGKKMVVVK
jgi:hypothetical protein